MVTTGEQLPYQGQILVSNSPVSNSPVRYSPVSNCPTSCDTHITMYKLITCNREISKSPDIPSDPNFSTRFRLLSSAGMILTDRDLCLNRDGI